jgi:hypothetical protein
MGDFIGVAVLFNATKGMEIGMSYICGGLFGLAFCFVLFFMIKEPVIKIKVSKVDVFDNETKSQKAVKICKQTF